MSRVRVGHQTEKETSGSTGEKQQVCQPVTGKIAKQKKGKNVHSIAAHLYSPTQSVIKKISLCIETTDTF